MKIPPAVSILQILSLLYCSCKEFRLEIRPEAGGRGRDGRGKDGRGRDGSRRRQGTVLEGDKGRFSVSCLGDREPSLVSFENHTLVSRPLVSSPTPVSKREKGRPHIFFIFYLFKVFLSGMSRSASSPAERCYGKLIPIKDLQRNTLFILLCCGP